MAVPLVTSRRFWPLFWCQLLSALNDNFIKNALVMLALFGVGSSAVDEHEAGLLSIAAGAALVVPFFILSAFAGQLADKYDKALIARRLKLVEIVVVAAAAIGFWLSSIPLLFLALVGLGILAALFGPIKYGILPDHLEPRELPLGTALVEGATFLAILGGTIAGSFAVTGEVSSGMVALVMLALAVACWATAAMIPPTGTAAPGLVIDRNPVTSTIALIAELRTTPRLWIGGLICSWFWFVGFASMSLLPPIVKTALNGTPGAATVMLLVFTVSVAAGSGMAARVSRMRPNLAVVPVAAVLMGVACLYLAWTLATATPPARPVDGLTLLASWSGWHVVGSLAVLAFAGGLFVVPAFAAVQGWAAPDKRARTVAAVNVLNAAFMTAAAVVLALLGMPALGVGLAGTFLLLGIASIGVAGLVLRAWGRDGLRDLAMLLFRTIYRLEVRGLENLPAPGTPAIVAPNHVSFMDGPVMHAILPDHAAFAVDTGIAKAWWIAPFLKHANVYTMDPTQPLATRTLVDVVRKGQTLVIFPEGRLTVTGGLMKVYDGAAMIADKADAVIVPVRIDGFEHTGWSFLRPTQIPRILFPRVRVTILKPRKLAIAHGLAAKSRRQAAGAALQDIMVDTAVETARIDRTLFEALLDARRTRDTGQAMVIDPLETKLTYRTLIAGSQMLGEKLAARSEPGEAVGVMLPNTAGVTVVFFGLQSIGRVPAMINYTSGPRNVVAACRAAVVKTVLTSRAFVEKGHLEPLVDALKEAGVSVVHLEDIRSEITIFDKIRALLASNRPLVECRPQDPAVILFTSGSEGTPKGVVLSHTNILANTQQALARIAGTGEDKFFNVLPVFHSFGMTAGMVMPLTNGIPVFMYPSPLHYRIVPELVYQTNATVLFGTDTFLNGYARTAHPYDFRSLRFILAGAEAVKSRTRDIYMERFGVRILEGYGVTETAPVLAVNTPLANRIGTVGRISPLMQARLVPVPGIPEGGRLLVKGPNVMLGYYRAENPGRLEPPQDGWHDTGDIVTIDEAGFITIKGRAKRFAKVAGEMVSLAAIEALAADIWPAIQSVVVTVPDARKGERIVLLATDVAVTRDELLRRAKQAGMTELAVPAEVMLVDAIPLLGSGKPDYVTATALARTRQQTASAA